MELQISMSEILLSHSSFNRNILGSCCRPQPIQRPARIRSIIQTMQMVQLIYHL
jgi:hypothetical protein